MCVCAALLAASWAVLTPQEYGLKFNGATITMDDDTVYSSGRIYVGVGGSFYKFPRKLTYVEFSAAYGNALDVWSADGQQLFVEVRRGGGDGRWRGRLVSAANGLPPSPRLVHPPALLLPLAPLPFSLLLSPLLSLLVVLVVVQASFYYQLKGDKIHDIFYTYGTGFGKIVYYMAAETIRNVATDYVTADFFTNRSAIDQTMQAALQA